MVPPFGNLCGLRVYAAQALLHGKDVVFGAGSFTLAIRISLKDYLRVEKPIVLNLSTTRAVA